MTSRLSLHSPPTRRVSECILTNASRSRAFRNVGAATVRERGEDHNGRNIPLRTPPEVKEGKLAVEVLAANEPTNMYENSGLIWHYDDDNDTILTKEEIGGGVLVHLFSERDGKPGAASHKKLADRKDVWFRLEVEPGKLSAYNRTGAKEERLKIGQCDMLLRGEAKVGLTTAYAAKDAEHLTRFSGFRMLQVPILRGYNNRYL